MHILSVLIFAAGLGAEPVGISARRNPAHGFQPYFQAARQLSRQSGSPFGKMTRATAVTEQAVAFGGASSLRPAPSWDTEAELMERFRMIRDARVLRSPSRPALARRATWLFPDDGCYARAALAVRTLMAGSSAIRPPGKIFAFGDLTVATPNVPGGRVSWWYHVAPVVRVGQRTFVLDPSIDPEGPMSVDDWIARQSVTPASTLVAICGSGTYVPSDRCDLVSDGIEATALADEGDLLAPEWARLVELGRHPELELGDHPPWSPRSGLPGGANPI